MTKNFAVLGHPISHSLSPRIHQHFANQFGIKINYQAIDVDINNFSKKEKEHVTKFFYNNSTKIKIKNFKSNIKKKLFNQTIDTRKDLIFMKKKFKKELKTNL